MKKLPKTAGERYWTAIWMLVNQAMALRSAELLRRPPARLEQLRNKLEASIKALPGLVEAAIAAPEPDHNPTADAEVRLDYSSDPRKCRGGNCFLGRGR